MKLHQLVGTPINLAINYGAVCYYSVAMATAAANQKTVCSHSKSIQDIQKMSSWFYGTCVQSYLCKFWCNSDGKLWSCIRSAEADYANLTF